MLRNILYIILFLGSVLLKAQDRQLATEYFRNGEYEKAVSLYEKLYKNNNHNTYYLKYLIKSYQGLEDYEKAQKIIEKQQEKRPNQKFLLIELGYNYHLQHQDSLANTFYEKAAGILNQKPQSGYLIAKSFQDHHLLDYALSAYNTMMQALPTANYNYQIASIYGEKGDIAKMFDTYLDMVNKQGGSLHNIERFIGRFVTDDAQDKNNLIFRKLLIKRLQENPKYEWNKLLSWLYLQQKDYGKALIQEKAVFLREQTNLDGIIKVGSIAFDAKDYSTAKNAFTYIIKNTSDRELQINATYYLLESERKTKDNTDEINKLYQKTFETFGSGNNTIQLQISYADFLTFDRDNPEKAIEILKNALKNRLDKFQKANIQIQLSDILVYTGKYNQALINYSQVQLDLKNHNLAHIARFKVAQTSYFKGDFDWANIQLKVLKKGTSNLISNDAIDLSLLIDDNTAQDSIPIALKKYAQADLLAYQNKNQQALDTLSVILREFKGHPIEDEAFYKQGTLFEKQKNYQAALDSYLNILKLKDNDILIDDALFKIAELYDYHLNIPEKAKEYYKKIVFEQPSSIYLVTARKRFRQLRGDELVQ